MGDSGGVCHQPETAHSPNEHEQRHGKQYVSAHCFISVCSCSSDISCEAFCIGTQSFRDHLTYLIITNVTEGKGNFIFNCPGKWDSWFYPSLTKMTLLYSCRCTLTEL